MCRTRCTYVWYVGRMSETKQISVAVEADDYATIKSAAFRSEMTLAAYVRETLLKAARWKLKEEHADQVAES